jgi:hypothetical protein
MPHFLGQRTVFPHNITMPCSTWFKETRPKIFKVVYEAMISKIEINRRTREKDAAMEHLLIFTFIFLRQD